jgi:hypothetical protein
MRIGLPICALIGIWASSAFADIISAKFSDPTTRYNHGILGDAIEYGSLHISVTDKVTGTNTTVTIELPWDHVFEDIKPRLADIDGDGDFEVIVIETDVSKGAALAVYDAFGKLAETPHIGQSHRWLAPVGIADFNGDGDIDIAYIDRPHLAKRLRVWSYRNGKLVKTARAKNLTNHKIGWDFIAGGVRDCGTGPEIITANGSWRKIMSTRMNGVTLRSETIGPYNGPDSLKAALGC